MLIAPSTSASAALVRPIDSDPRTSEERAINAKFLLCFLSPSDSASIDLQTQTHGIANLHAATALRVVNSEQSCWTFCVTVLTRTRLGRSAKSVR